MPFGPRTRRQHAAYYQVVWAIAALPGVAAIAVGLSMTLADWLVTFLLPAMPALVDAADLGTAHRDIAARKQELEEQVQALWETALASPGTLTEEDCRVVQDEAFKLLCNGQHPYPDGKPQLGEDVRDPLDIRPDLIKELADFLKQACAPYHEDRFSTAVNMRRALQDVRTSM